MEKIELKPTDFGFDDSGMYFDYRLHATEAISGTVYESVPVDALVEALRTLIHDISGLISESCGVDGLHLNGDVAPWESLLEGGEFECWLGGLSVAESALSAWEHPMTCGRCGNPTDQFVKVNQAQNIGSITLVGLSTYLCLKCAEDSHEGD